MCATRADKSERQIGMDRRELLGRLFQLSVVAAVAGCTPVRYVLHLYPETYDGTDAGDRVLAAFAHTVIPGLPWDASAFRALTDEQLPFHRFAGFLAADLDARAQRTFGQGFVSLSPPHRTRVVADGLECGGTTGQLYAGAVFLTQIACYAGIYNDTGGCPLIDFHGASGLQSLEATTFSNPETFLAETATVDGNPA